MHRIVKVYDNNLQSIIIVVRKNQLHRCFLIKFVNYFWKNQTALIDKLKKNYNYIRYYTRVCSAVRIVTTKAWIFFWIWIIFIFLFRKQKSLFPFSKKMIEVIMNCHNCRDISMLSAIYTIYIILWGLLLNKI